MEPLVLSRVWIRDVTYLPNGGLGERGGGNLKGAGALSVPRAPENRSPMRKRIGIVVATIFLTVFGLGVAALLAPPAVARKISCPTNCLPYIVKSDGTICPLLGCSPTGTCLFEPCAL